jgi:hypothetical protein
VAEEIASSKWKRLEIDHATKRFGNNPSDPSYLTQRSNVFYRRPAKKGDWCDETMTINSQCNAIFISRKDVDALGPPNNLFTSFDADQLEAKRREQVKK